MSILGVDTSLIEFTSIGVFFSEYEKLEINFFIPCSQEEKLLLSIDYSLKIIKKNIEDIEIFAVGLGPGSFTGLRIGIATIKGLAWSLNKKIIGISSLTLLVESINFINENYLYIPIIDAKMNRIFCSIFKGKNRLTEDMDIEPVKLLNILNTYKEDNIIFLGYNSKKFENYFLDLKINKNITFVNNYISGLSICEYALKNQDKIIYDINKLEPFYLRKSAAEELKNL